MSAWKLVMSEVRSGDGYDEFVKAVVWSGVTASSVSSVETERGTMLGMTARVTTRYNRKWKTLPRTMAPLVLTDGETWWLTREVIVDEAMLSLRVIKDEKVKQRLAEALTGIGSQKEIT